MDDYDDFQDMRRAFIFLGACVMQTAPDASAPNITLMRAEGMWDVLWKGHEPDPKDKHSAGPG